MKTFIVVHCRLVCNEFGTYILHSSDLVPYDTKAKAVEQGYKQAGCDDFNVGVLEDGFLVSIDWMEKVVNAHPEPMARISEELGLPKRLPAENPASR